MPEVRAIRVRAGVRELVEQASPQSVNIFRAKGRLIVSVDAVNRFEPNPSQRTFNLISDFAAVPLIVAIQPGDEVFDISR